MILKTTSNKTELEQIKLLQSQNLKQHLSSEEMQREGFVTASYTIEQLEKMNAFMPSVIAVDKNQVVGYALAVNKDLKGEHELLDDLIDQIDKHYFKGIYLKEVTYAIVGQLCVAKSHRGQGLSQSLYNHYKECYASQYPFLITDIDKKNIRSLNAHLKCGFEIIGSLTFNHCEFAIVAWDWKNTL